jgi:hypothetical protein
MRVHIIGYGNMGKKYEAILKAQGHEVTHSDIDGYIERDASHYIITTPPETHIEAAWYPLVWGARVMIEKPIACTVEEAERIKEFASQIWVVNNYTDWRFPDGDIYLEYKGAYPEGTVPNYLDLTHFTTLFEQQGVHGTIIMDFKGERKLTLEVNGNGDVYENNTTMDYYLAKNLEYFLKGGSNYFQAVEGLRKVIHPKKVQIWI